MSEDERYTRRLRRVIAAAAGFGAYGLAMAEYLEPPWPVLLPILVAVGVDRGLEALRRWIIRI